MNAKQVMRNFLSLDAEHRKEFDRMREVYAATLVRADQLPERHPDKSSRRWDAVRRFKEIYDL